MALSQKRKPKSRFRTNVLSLASSKVTLFVHTQLVVYSALPSKQNTGLRKGSKTAPPFFS